MDERHVPRLGDGLRIEEVGDEVVVLDAAQGLVHRLNGDAAAAARHLLTQGPEGALGPDVVGLDELVDAGIVVSDLPRRRVLRAGAGALVGVSTFALPSALAAATITGPNGSVSVAGGTTSEVVDGSTTYVVHTFTADGDLVVTGGSVDVQYVAVGGGGGGGGGGFDTSVGYTISGGGGGGGEVVTSTGLTTGSFVTLAAGTYPVTVGAGGSAGTSGSRTGTVESPIDVVPTSGGGGGGSSLGGLASAGGGTGGDAGTLGDGTGGDGGASGGAAFLGGDGFAYSGGGGGGSDGTGGGGDYFVGGDGGAATSLEDFTAATLHLGGGGGGGGLNGGGSAGTDAGAGSTGYGDGGIPPVDATVPTANRGGGGGGGSGDQSSSVVAEASAGASGVVMLRYEALT